jgi:uncharacterized coiled-coil protein SlyX
MELEERVTNLEMQNAYFEKHVADLNDVILNQQVVLETLRKKIASLESQVAALSEAQLKDSTEEAPPPHY